MFNHLARGIARHPVWTIVSWLVIAAASIALATAGVTGQSLFDRVNSGEPMAVDSESTRADTITSDASTTGQSLTLIIGDVDMANPQVLAALTPPMAEGAAALTALPGVASAVTPAILPDGPANPAAAPLLAANGRGLLMVVELDKDLSAQAETDAVDRVVDELHRIAAGVRDAVPGATSSVGGGPLIADAIVDQMEKDLTTGELVALPIALIVMVVVFAGFAAAFMPLFAALAAIASALGALFATTFVTDVHTSVINVVTIIGVGLSIDYGLLIVSRFREELRARSPREHAHRTTHLTVRALAATLTTAGRTVAFSALTIAASVAGLMAFKPSILRTYGLAGFVIVVIALLTAITLVPACLALLGPRMARPSILARIPGVGRAFRHRAEIAPETGVFSRLAGAVQAKPWIVIVGVLAVLGLLASPAAHMSLRSSTVEFLPANSDQRHWLDQLRDEYPATATPPITLVSLGTPDQTQAFADNDVASLDAVKSVTTVPRDGYTEVRVYLTTDDPQSAEARGAVANIRAMRPGFDVLVTGQAGQIADYIDQLAAGAPWAALIVALATLLLLFAMTGSVLIPIKALLTNVLSLAACMGVLTWIFQDGHLADQLGFTPQPGIESYIVVLLMIFGFGLAMDYEMFLISRIKESWDAGLDSNAAVRQGLQRSGRIITSAALIIIVVFAGFAAGQLVIIKQIGMGLAIAVALDATLVRMLLVPATMTVLGRWNWWSPRWIAGLRDRVRPSH
ncbi:MAG: MMPL family transporter [Bifidobacteriaceae bacterium]|nr:MMPL family transporter [Bifidobacteriaceae bacterium]